MNHLYAGIVASAITAMATPSFAAAKFAPANTNFTLAGSFPLEQSSGSTGFNCPFTFTGLVTKAGVIEIEQATFCAGVQASGLPWTWQAVQPQPAAFKFTSALFINGFNCGIFTALGFDKRGLFKVANITSANGCMMVGTGYGQSTPAIKIKP